MQSTLERSADHNNTHNIAELIMCHVMTIAMTWHTKKGLDFCQHCFISIPACYGPSDGLCPCQQIHTLVLLVMLLTTCYSTVHVMSGTKKLLLLVQAVIGADPGTEIKLRCQPLGGGLKSFD